MKGLRIFTHSVKLVFGNFGMALRISGVLYLGGGLLMFLAVVVGYVRLEQAGLAGKGAPWGWLILGVAIFSFCFLWIAVTWHRYILLNEVPTGLVPRFNGGAILAYFGRGLLVSIAVLLTGLVVGFAGVVCTGIATHLFPAGAGMLVMIVPGVLFFTVILLVAYRLAPMLPAAALRADLPMAEAWRRTSGNWGSLLILALVSALFNVVLEIPQRFLLPNMAGAVWSVLTVWVETMVGVSILTTLYGHFVEGRELR